jgi:hypothetical protein
VLDGLLPEIHKTGFINSGGFGEGHHPKPPDAPLHPLRDGNPLVRF